MDECPNGCDLTGEPIPEASRHLYGGKTHFARRFGNYDQSLDRTVSWSCPDCGITWPR